MNKIINILFPFIWSLGVVFFSTVLLLISMSKIDNKNNIDKKKVLNRCKILFLITVLCVLGSVGLYAIFRINIFYISEFVYEAICCFIIIFTFIGVENIKFKIIEVLKLDTNEKIILLFSIIFSFICISILTIKNKYYIFPQDIYGEIGNFYFNADIGRGIESATGLRIPHIIHPTYRFIIYPLVMPISILIRILSKVIVSVEINKLFILGYYLCFIQIIFNSISAIIFYKILNTLKTDKKVATIATLIFSFSFSSVWLSILPETYGITLLLLLLAIYLFQKKKNFSYVISFIVITTNPMVAITIIPMAIFDIYKYKIGTLNTIKYYIKQHKILSTITLTSTLLFILIVGVKFTEYIIKWTNINENIKKNISESLEYLITAWFIGPKFENINPYFVQSLGQSLLVKVSILIIIIFCIVALIKGRKENLIISIGITLVGAWILHGIMGYGRYNGIIYAPLYSWAAIILLVYAINVIIKNSIYKKIILGIIAFIIIIYNIMWVVDIGNELKEIRFSESEGNNPIEFYIEFEDSYDKYLIFEGKIFRNDDQEVILDKLDGYRINKDYETISGLLSDSSWFKIYSSDNKIYLNIQGNITSIEEKESTNSEFFIFGMGLRKKYIFTKKENGWTFIDYYNDNIIFENAICEKIDAVNYKVNGYLENGIEFEIYENEKGIYLKKGQAIEVLDESISINIPEFEYSKYNDQLKILFNEVMINITDKGPTPNFIVYPNPWYRDAAMMAMVIEKTGNLKHIDKWIRNIDNIYDEQNGNKEPDNLGQVLYLLSLIDNPNKQLIREILNEAEKLKGTNTYINGITDGDNHPVYQTRWLIYGLKSLGLDYSKYKIPYIDDTYASLMWFDGIENTELENTSIIQEDRWPYLYYARLNFYNKNIIFKDKNYPISSELSPGKPEFEKLAIINEKLVNNKLVVPHGWSAAEMFFYLLNKE